MNVCVRTMAWLNIVGLLIIFFVGKPEIQALKDDDIQRKSNPDEYTFDPLNLGVKGATLWEQRIEKINLNRAT